MAKQRQFKVDFFVCTDNGDRNTTLIDDLFEGAENHYLEARSITGDADERHQVRSIQAVGKGKIFKGVFGRWRNNTMPVQGNEAGEEDDVVLKAGYGLVEKNFFIYYTENNLLLYQRNSSGSHNSRFQRYLSELTGTPIGLEPILTTDSYERIIHGGAPKWIDFSIQPPKDPNFYGDEWSQKAMQLLNGANAYQARMKLSTGRAPQHLLEEMKEAIVSFAKSGRARVARIKLEEDNEPIDLIADRIVGTCTVDLDKNGRASPDDTYAAIAALRDHHADDLKTFFGG